MPYEGEIEVNDLPQGTTPNQADKVMLIDNATGALKLFNAATLGSVISRDDGLTEEIKQALLMLAQKVAYIDEDGQDYYDALYAALYTIPLIAISATFTQGQNAIYSTDSLNYLKQFLTVTAIYSNGTAVEVQTYELSGTLTAGTSVITVSYGGKTTTFNVTVTGVTLFPGKYVLYTSFAYSDATPPILRYYNDSTTKNRVAYVLDGTGEHSIARANTSQASITIYPMPIPATANTLVLQKDNDNQGTLAYMSTWNGSNWEKVRAIGSDIYGRQTRDISDINDGTLYITFSSRNLDNDNSITTADRTNWSFGWAE